MSGGQFDYKQEDILQIADDIEALISLGPKLGDTRITKSVIPDLRKAEFVLRAAYILAGAVDWYLSGDDNEAELHKKINEVLVKLKSGL